MECCVIDARADANGGEQSWIQSNLWLGGATLGQGVGSELDTYWIRVSESYYAAWQMHVLMPMEVNSLSGNKISDSGAQHLAKALEVNSTLITLWWVNHRILTDWWMHILIPMEVNSLHGNQISDSGAQHLAEMLKMNSTLTRLM